jgi:hypothetical protein
MILHQPPGGSKRMSRWAWRRLFERLIALDALGAKLRSRHVENFLTLTRCMTARQKRSGAGEETQTLGPDERRPHKGPIRHWSAQQG